MCEKFNIFEHKLGSRVIDPKTGRKGHLLSIRETANEWITPFIVWDGTQFEVAADYVDLWVEHDLEVA